MINRHRNISELAYIYKTRHCIYLPDVLRGQSSTGPPPVGLGALKAPLKMRPDLPDHPEYEAVPTAAHDGKCLNALDEFKKEHER